MFRINLPALFSLILLSSLFAVIDAQSEEAADSSRAGQVLCINDQLAYRYQKPAWTTFIKHFPGDLRQYGQITFRRSNLVNIAVMTALTGVLVAVDQPVLDETQRFGKRLGLPGNNKMKRAFYVLGFPIEVPRDWDTALYFLGDGWTHTGVALGFLGYGLAAKSNRALQTASQIAEGMATTGFATQFIKHITGRESPFTATVAGGKWKPFPNQFDYHKHVPRYDAFPSGHLATAMMTVTVIAENYPEKKFIRPIGYGLMTILSFEMVNNGVHWVSDYPLALALGYTLGKIAVSRGREKIETGQQTRRRNKIQLGFYPLLNRAGVGIMMRL